MQTAVNALGRKTVYYDIRSIGAYTLWDFSNLISLLQATLCNMDLINLGTISNLIEYVYITIQDILSTCLQTAIENRLCTQINTRQVSKCPTHPPQVSGMAITNLTIDTTLDPHGISNTRQRQGIHNLINPVWQIYGWRIKFQRNTRWLEVLNFARNVKGLWSAYTRLSCPARAKYLKMRYCQDQS